MNVGTQRDGQMGERANLKLEEMSRNMYLFLPLYLMNASSFLRTMRSQMTTSFFTLDGGRASVYEEVASEGYVPRVHSRIPLRGTGTVASYSSGTAASSLKSPSMTCCDHQTQRIGAHPPRY